MRKRERAEPDLGGTTRRELLHGGARIALALPLAAASGALLAACGSEEPQRPPPPPPKRTQPVEPAPAPEPAPAAPEPAPSPAPPTAGGAEAGPDDLVTALPAVAPMVQALQYVNQSTKPDQSCANCQLFTAGEGGLGKCQLFPEGRVRATGWCMSWAPKTA